MLKSTELKLRQVSVTKVKDWQKKFKQMEQEKKVLEDMVRTAKFQQQGRREVKLRKRRGAEESREKNKKIGETNTVESIG